MSDNPFRYHEQNKTLEQLGNTVKASVDAGRAHGLDDAEIFEDLIRDLGLTVGQIQSFIDT